MNVAGQRVLVTGASSGIGEGLAVRFAEEGATVGICARRGDRLEEVVARCRKHAPESRMWVHDLADPAQVDELARAAVDELGGVDILVNNAGIPKRRRIDEIDIETVEQVMNINYLSPIRLTLRLLPQMVKRKHGLVLNVSSISATLSSPGETTYCASKAALTAFSESMAVDLWDTGVRTLVIYPGVVDTDLFRIPGNDPLPDGVGSIPVSELVDGVFAAIDADVREAYIPAWFKDIATGKASNLETFLAGSAEFMRSQGRLWQPEVAGSA